MLISRKSKTVFSNKNGGHLLNFPQEAFKLLGKDYIFDLYENRVVMYPASQLGKIKVED